MRLITFLILCVLHINTQAQSTYQINWSGLFGSNYTAGGAVAYGAEYGHKVVSDAQNNVYFIGTFQSSFTFNMGMGSISMNYPIGGQAPSDRIYYVAKCNSNGDIIWTKPLGTFYPNDNNHAKLNALTLDKYGQILVCGNAHEYVPYPFPNFYLIEAKIWKLDTNGNLIWSKVFNTVNKANSGTGELVSIGTDTSQNIVLLGQYSDSIDTDPSIGVQWLSTGSTSIQDLILLKLDSLGNLIWSNPINGPYNEEIYNMSINKSNQIFISGICGAYTDFDPDSSFHYLDTTGSYIPFVASYSPDGNLRWVQKLHATVLHSTPTNDLLISGYLNQTPNINPLGSPITPPFIYNSDTYLASYDTSGLNHWYKTFYCSTINNDLDFKSLTTSSDKRIYVAGKYANKVDFDPDIAVINTDTINANAFILQLDSIGKFLSVKEFNQPSATVASIEINDQVINTNNDIILCGRIINIFSFNTDSSDLNPDDNYAKMIFPSGTADGFLLNLSNCTQHIYDTILVCDSIVVDNNVYYSSFEYNKILHSLTSCDTTQHLFYQFIILDTAIIQNGPQLISQCTNCQYNWLSCNPFSILSNDTNQIFSPQSSGYYAVAVSNQGCTDTSSCIYVGVSGVSEFNTDVNPIVYPNPTSKTIHINLPEEETILCKNLWTIQSELLCVDQSSNPILFITDLASGLYYLELQTSKRKIWIPIVVSHN